MSTHNERDAGLVVAIAWSLCAAGAVALGWRASVVGVALTLPLALLLPGYAIARAIFGRRVGDIAEMLAMSLGLSLVVAIAGGFLLNLTPVGLRAGSWTVYLASVTILGAVAARARAPRRVLSSSKQARRIQFAPRQAILLAAALAITLVAFVVANAGASTRRDGGFTQLWTLPGPITSQGDSVTIGVSSRETAPVSYAVTLSVDGTPLETWDGVTLNPGESWQQTMVIPVALLHGGDRADVQLYRANAPESVYRHTLLWLSAPSSATATATATGASAALQATRQHARGGDE